MMRMRVLVMGALLTTLGTFLVFAQSQSTRTATSKQPKLLVLRGGLLVDGTGGAPLSNAVVTISGGKIQSVGREGSATIPADAEVIDTSGKTILPGLVDSHVHLRNFQASAYLYWGVTTVGDLGDPTGWTLAYRAAVEKGRAIGPHIMATGAKFNAPLKPGDNASPGDLQGFKTFLMGVGSATIVTDEASVERAVTAAKKAGVDALKLYTRMDPALLKLAAEAAHRHGLPVFSHHSSAFGTDAILDTGIDVEVHFTPLLPATAPKEIQDRIARGENVQAFHLLDTSKFPALARKMVEKNMFFLPTLRGRYGVIGKHRQEFDRLNTTFVKGPVVAGFPEAVRTRLAATFKPSNAEGIARRVEEEEGFKRVGLFIKQFVDQGGKVLVGTDTGSGAAINFTGAGNALLTAGLPTIEEMQLLSEMGLTPMQVIQAATSWPMEAWRKSKEVGTVEAGKRADVLILNRNPLEDMAAITDIFKVIQGGSVVDREGLATWQETLPKPTSVQADVPNSLVRVPFIDEISPESVAVSQRNGSELAITGENFSKDNLVLINDRLVPAKSQGKDQLAISIPSDLLKKPGLYPLVVVQPGSAGGVSNTFYFIVTPD